MVSLPSIRKIWAAFPPFFKAAAATVPVLAVTVYLSLESRTSERLLLEAEFARQADNAFLQFQEFVGSHVETLRETGNFVLATQIESRPDRPADITPFVVALEARTPGFVSITLTDASRKLLQAVPKPQSPWGDANDLADPQAFAKAMASHQPAATGVFELPGNQRAFSVAVPIVRDGNAEGAVIGIIRLTDYLPQLFGRDVLDFWNLRITDRSGHEVFRSTAADGGDAALKSLSVERHVPVADRAWKMTMTPTSLLLSTLRTGAPRRILSIGLLASLITALANFALAQRQVRLAQSLNESERLTEDVEATRRHLTDLVNGIDAVIWESDATTGWFTFVNDFALKMLGMDTAQWMSAPEQWFEHVHPDDRARVRENARQLPQPGHTYPAEYRMLDSAGKIIWVREIVTVIARGGKVIGRRGVVVDISARVQAEDALRQSQKLESLGVLAGGIAHDFNNLLTTIMGNAEMLGPFLTGRAALGRTHLDKIERTTRRLAELTRQMLAYSGRGQFTLAEVDVNAIITEMTELLSVSTPKNVRVVFRLDPQMPLMEGDAAQIRQVVLNLLTNAAEAVGEHQRGEVIIETGNLELSATQASESFPEQDLEPGMYVRLEVSDTGCGMSPETQASIFDPFFTTKFTGRGLGLAALRGIVRRHHGGIRIFSRLGEGTVFTLLFPASRHRPGVSTPNLPGPAHTSDFERTTILVIDDEESLRSLMADALEAVGAKVIQAIDGEDGIGKFGAHRDDISAVVLDLTMPKLNGDEVFRQIKAARPELPVVLCSGYTQEDVARQFTGRDLAGFIEKPFKPSELVEKLRVILAANASNARTAIGRPIPGQRAGEVIAQGDRSRNPAPDRP